MSPSPWIFDWKLVSTVDLTEKAHSLRRGYIKFVDVNQVVPVTMDVIWNKSWLFHKVPLHCHGKCSSSEKTNILIRIAGFHSGDFHKQHHWKKCVIESPQHTHIVTSKPA
uniref:uncharacterized protein LOC122594879 n=1 Tax=Erigeron canadensis TaxID=72917 RepID=UPI001CB91E83|nr:uncharacterized protein LOC122594879 [Erigeron canadensis]